MAKKDLTVARLRELLAYDPDTGAFTNRITRSSVAPAGRESGKVNADGYRQIQIDRRMYSAHRLAWLYVYGEWPQGLLDHINRQRDDNRIANLRMVSQAENSQNCATYSTNTSGYRGVTWDDRGQKWRATITVDGRKMALGSHTTREKAYAAYLRAAQLLHSTNAAVAEHQNLI